MGLQRRSSVLAIMEETTEGTPVVVSGATDFVEMQDDFDMTPAFETLESAALKSSIGKSKSILGAENPTASMSHYLKHSGVEGQAPQYNVMLKSLFGTETVNGTERDTIAGSTTTAINVDTGEGATDFPRGTAMLVKDGTNGYSIAVSEAESSDVITPLFALANAPASGVNLGKAVTYSPASSGHVSLCLWEYLSNGGAIELMAGAKVTSMSIGFSGGELINANFSMEGTNYKFNPITITASNEDIDFNDGGVQVASLANKTYKDPHELAAEIQSKMDAQSTDTITCTYSDSTGKMTIVSDGALFSLLWSTGTNTATNVGTTIGFLVAADDTGSLTYTSDNAISWAAGYAPTYDASDPLAAKNHIFYLGDQTDNVCFAPSTVDVAITNTRASKRSICAESGISGSVITGREVTVSVTAFLAQHDVDKFRKFRENEDTRAMYVFGNKSAGNWIAGKAGALSLMTSTIKSFNIGDVDGLATLELELDGYINADGEGEVYLSYV